MINKCVFSGKTPLHFCRNCPLLLETCCFIVTEDGYALGAECSDYYLCPKCTEDCIFTTYVNL